jgi:hypothetical protein
MIEMKCPACGAGGRAPREKIGARLVCKKCLRVFHLTPSGQAVLGEPPQPKEAPREKAARETYGIETPEAFEQLAHKIANIKLPTPRTFGIMGAVALVGLLGYWFFSRQPLEARARTVAEAIIKTDMKQVVDMCVPGTENEAIQWYAETYKKYMNLKLALGHDAGIKIKTLGESKGNATTVIAVFAQEGQRGEGTALLDTIQTIPSLSNTPAVLEVPLFFVVNAWGNWVLDGKRTAIGGEFGPVQLPGGPSDAAAKKR